MDKLMKLGLVERLKNRNFFLENRTAELHQNENSKQLDRPDAA